MTSEELILKAIDDAVLVEAGQEPGRFHLGMSGLGEDCEKAIWNSWRWVYPEEFLARILKLFDRGNAEEAVFTKRLRAAGITVWDVDAQGNQFRIKHEAGHLAGSTDGVALNLPDAPDVPTLLEMKTHNDKSFKNLVKHGVAVSKPVHLAQMLLYMSGMNLQRALYLAVNKNDDSWHVELVQADPDAAEVLLNKGKRIIASTTPPTGISTNPTFFKCRWCSSQPVCQLGATPKMNCRTCQYAKPVTDSESMDAPWECRRHEKPIDGPSQKAGCQDHVYIPELLEIWAKKTDEGPGFVKYQHLTSGNEFVNGNVENGYLSSEIEKCRDTSVIGDELVDTFKANFSARMISSTTIEEVAQ